MDGQCQITYLNRCHLIVPVENISIKVQKLWNVMLKNMSHYAYTRYSLNLTIFYNILPIVNPMKAWY